MSAGGTGQMSSPVMARKSCGLDWPVPRAGQDPLIPCSRAYFVNSAVLWMPNPAVNRIHPTAKPVELIERALLNSSTAGDVVSATLNIVCPCAVRLRFRSFGDLHQVAGADPLCEGRLHLLRRHRGVSIRGLSGFVQSTA